MIRRFHIEDLITQDPWGVIFRAIDKESGKAVAVRRFFPFGADGGGLKPDDQPVYQNAVQHLAGLSHPALRAVVCGGCDPVDAMPYIATEWIEGRSVREYLEHGPLPAEAAIDLVTQALELSEVLSHVLGEEQVWVETDLQTIIVGNAESGRGFTFWMSPLKWVGGHERGKGLWPVVALAEEVMGWQNRNVGDDEGYGFGGWLKWLRLNAGKIGLQEARETLAASIGVDPPLPTHKLVIQASRPLASRMKQARSYWMWAVNGLLGVAAVGLLVWFYLQQQAHQRMAGQLRDHRQEDSPSALREAALRRATATTTPAAAQPPGQPQVAPPPVTDDGPANPAPTSPPAPADGVLEWTQRDQLMQHNNQEVLVEGKLLRVDLSHNKSRVHLVFTRPLLQTDARGTVEIQGAPPDLNRDALKSLVGKTLRIRGTVMVQSVSNKQRPEVLIRQRAAIETLD